MDQPFARLDSVNSFNEYDMNTTPKGSIHTSKNFDNGGLVYRGSH